MVSTAAALSCGLPPGFTASERYLKRSLPACCSDRAFGLWRSGSSAPAIPNLKASRDSGGRRTVCTASEGGPSVESSLQRPWVSPFASSPRYLSTGCGISLGSDRWGPRAEGTLDLFGRQQLGLRYQNVHVIGQATTKAFLDEVVALCGGRNRALRVGLLGLERS